MAQPKIKKETCTHFGEMKITETAKKMCEECGERENLRLCTSCGSVFCCESHKAHNRLHWLETKHPIIVPLPTGTPLTWIWCWEDKAYLE